MAEYIFRIQEHVEPKCYGSDRYYGEHWRREYNFMKRQALAMQAERDRLLLDVQKWRSVAELNHSSTHDGGCYASDHSKKMQARGEWPKDLPTKCDCGFDAYEQAVRGD